MHRSAPFVALVALVALVSACAHPAATSHPTPVAAAGANADTANKKPKIKPYAKVITADAVTARGLVITHKIDQQLFFEIPRSVLGADLLVEGRYARSAPQPGDFDGYGGDEFGTRVVRWEQDGKRIVLRSPNLHITADSELPVAEAVRSSDYPPVIAVFNIEAFGPDSAPVIDVTPLYTTAVAEFVALRGPLDDKRSYIEHVAAFPDNVEVEATQTASPPPPRPGSPEPPPVGPQPVQSVLAHWSMVRLPVHPMQPRLADDRVGYFTADVLDYGRTEQKAVTRKYIDRWRLEKKDPNAALSDPVQPIVYYIDRATPAQWVPYVKAGIEEWQPAFAAAGFRNAIVARLEPTAAEDPTWSPEDIRHTVVRWLTSTVENSVGPNVHDPRTGEVLNGSVRMFHNILNLQRAWYVTQVGPLDSRTWKLPMPDSLMGRLVQFVVAHEVGHTLGFPHNMKASAEYPADSVRSRTWVHRMGHSPSVMDYARFNYVAQPEDSIALDDLIPRVGPYDVYATRWGYTPIPSVHSPDAEKPTLDQWSREQDTVPWYRFSTENDRGADPGSESEAIGDADPVKSTTAGMRNIRREMGHLLAATDEKGESVADLSELYDRLIGQWSTELRHVANQVAGVESQEKYGGQPGPRFTPMTRERQAAAVAFLGTNAFQPPEFFFDSAVVRRIEPDGAIARINRGQRDVLQSLLSSGRVDRLIEFEALTHDPNRVYRPESFLGDVRHTIWSELAGGAVVIGAVRRGLQDAYIDQIDALLHPKPFPVPASQLPPRLLYLLDPMSNDAGSLLRQELILLDGEIRAAQGRTTDPETKAHLAAARYRISHVLYPEAKGEQPPKG